MRDVNTYDTTPESFLKKSKHDYVIIHVLEQTSPCAE